MSLDVLGDLNWWAVLVAALVYWILGAVWFSPMAFTKPWLESMGHTPDPDAKPGPATIFTPLISCLLMAVGLGVLASWGGADGFGDGIRLGLVAGVGLVSAVLGITAYFEPTKVSRLTWGAITVGYHFVGVLIVAIIVSIWT